MEVGVHDRRVGADARVVADGDPFVTRDGRAEADVDVVAELVKLIMAQRAYEVNSRAVKAGDEMMSNAARLGRAG